MLLLYMLKCEDCKSANMKIVNLYKDLYQVNLLISHFF